MKNHVLFAVLLIGLATFLACGRVQWAPEQQQHISCIHGPGKDAVFFDSNVTNVEWHGTEVTFLNSAGAEVTLHVPTQVCAVFPASPAASTPPAAPPVAPSAPVTPVAPSDAGPVSSRDAGAPAR